ncbi:MAG: HAD family hydrolase [Patescibacteria group bacterium]
MNSTPKKAAFFDLDGTLIDAHVWVGMIKYSLNFKQNIFEALWYFLYHMALTPLWLLRIISKEEYYKRWGKDLPQMIKNIKISEGEKTFRWLSQDYLLPNLNKKVYSKLESHKKEGFLTILTSGSLENLLKIVTDYLENDLAVGTELEIINGKFTGKIVEPLCFGEGKIEKLKSFLEKKNLDIDFKESFAYSDSIFDLPLLELVGHPVAVNPDKDLLKIAKRKNWQIVV